MFLLLLLGSICANYLPSQLHNQAFVSGFPMGLYVKWGFAIQQAFLLNAPESPRSYNCASALLGPACHRDANPDFGAFVVSSGALCHCGSCSKGHSTREILSPSALAGPGTPTLASAGAGTFIGRGGKSSPTGNATLSPALDPLV